MSLVVVDDSHQKQVLLKEIALLKKAISDKQSVNGVQKQKKQKKQTGTRYKIKSKSKVRKPKHSKRSFCNPKLVRSSGASNSHNPEGDVEGGASLLQTEQQYFVSGDGKSAINTKIFRADLIRRPDPFEEMMAINSLKRKLEKLKAKNSMCDRVLVNGEKYSVVENGSILSPLTYYKNADDTIFWNDHWYEVTDAGYYLIEGSSRKCTNTQCKYSHLLPEHYGDSKYEIGICRPFSVGGWCPRGKNCPFLHVWNCPDYDEEVACPRGDSCSLNHVFTLRMQDRISTKSNTYVRQETLVQEEEDEEEESTVATSKVHINSFTVEPSVLLATNTVGNYQHFIDQAPFQSEGVVPAPSTQFLIEVSSDEEQLFDSEEE
ncbi:hypothetical protein KGF57_005249 [Candida theae]|uniref:C3H1-type domain-containing protein n=1 Tax=Candida theae TaxID=1198502 RepID=A0AAD5FWF5_9ASCO|nr:uncharacterized protein KGF57_005249 [Candida theae]KAI5948851.1 hypothetical protein KGF57_005249 [Candida theae]